MRVLVTGATGFVGRWLMQELAAAGHQPVPTPSSAILDIGDPVAVERAVREARPEAIAHLAAIASKGVAASDPDRAQAVNAGGTTNVLDAALAISPTIPVLVASSAEVYSPSSTGDALVEDSPLTSGEDAYARSKLAAESVGLAARGRGQPVVITRAFNHTGPGQGETYAIPAFARRIVAARGRGENEIVAGNVDVERDIGDVRDVVVAYRLLLERLAAGGLDDRVVFNVATGQAVRLRTIIEKLGRLAGIEVKVRRDDSLVRPGEPDRIVGDATALRDATGWRPSRTLDETLASIYEDVSRTLKHRPSGVATIGARS